MLTKTRAVFLMFALVLVLPQPAAAGTINVSGSMFFAGDTSGPIHLVGDRGFVLNVLLEPNEVSSGPLVTCRPCFSGQPISLGFSAIGGAFGGGATLDGIPYLVGLTQAILFLELAGAPLIAPPGNVASTVSLTNPVTLSGLFGYPSGVGPPFGTETLVGGPGLATVILKHSCPDNIDCWFVASADYEFQPTPEPATLLLWGTSVGGLALARWSRRRGSACR